jgi:hypothetical protein
VKRTLEKHVVIGDELAEFDGHPHWQLLQRILASPQFARSARLKTFLLYVTRCALQDRSEQVTEQQIGFHVFGKPADYNASEDNIVRSQARFLRVKLAEYFESEAGREEPVVLAIPKGSYLPHFSARTASAPLPPGSPAQAAPLARPSVIRHRLPWLLSASALGCLMLAGWLFWQKVPASAVPTAPTPGFWSQIFEPQRQTTIVASDYIFSMVQEAAGRTLTLDEYLAADYFTRIAQLNATSGLERLFPNIAQRHYTGFENVTNISRLANLKQAQSSQMVIRFARDMTMREVGSGNLVLMGSKQSNPWVSLFEARMNFLFDYQAVVHNIYVVNRAPQAGEEAEYRPSDLDAQSRVIYGGIAFVPNLKPGSNVLILQGTSMGGSEIALEFLDNPTLFRDLVRRLAPNGRKGGLPFFEALIRTRTLSGVAGESTVVACRVFSE